MGIDIRFTDADWERVERNWTAWWEGDLARPMVVVRTADEARTRSLSAYRDFTSSFPLSVPADEVIDHYQAHLEATRFHGDACPRFWPNFGPGIMAGFLGAQVRCAPETTWFEPAGRTGIEESHFSYDADNPWWRRVQEITRLAVARWGDRVAVGHTDLGGNLDILASLCTSEQLLLDLYDAPEEVERLAGGITGLWLRYYDELHGIIRTAHRGTTPWASIWSPGRCYMLQCDFSYMISPAMFERFVLPDLEACCATLDHAFYHLDGKGQIPHLDMLLSLRRLRGIQWVPGDGAPPPEEWLPLLKRIRDSGKLCQIFTKAQGVLAIVRALGGSGFAFDVLGGMCAAEAEDFVRLVAAESGARI